MEKLMLLLQFSCIYTKLNKLLRNKKLSSGVRIFLNCFVDLFWNNLTCFHIQSSNVCLILFNGDVTRQRSFPLYTKAANEGSSQQVFFSFLFLHRNTHTLSKTGSIFSSFIRLFPFYRFTFFVVMFMISKENGFFSST